ncbi:MAG: AAA family ATPase [Candidatus Midichloria sp.]|nr:AAA family ATPase [Candidatus Midichloria sp.]
MFDTLKRESGSSFNNVSIYGIAKPNFSRSFGFSEEEVRNLVAKLMLGDKEHSVNENIRAWYNGYKLQLVDSVASNVYNPWAVTKYLNEVVQNRFEPGNYWVKSDASIMLKKITMLYY